MNDARARGELALDVDLFPVPPPRGQDDVLAAVKTGFMVNRASPNPRAAVALVELLLSARYQARFAGLGYLSPRRDARDLAQDPLARRMLDVLAAAREIVPPPDTGHAPAQAQLAYRAVARLLAGETDLLGAARAWSDEKRDLARKGP